MTGWVYWLSGAALGVVLLVIVYVLAIRPWHMRLGATDDEVKRPLPGDLYVAHPKALASHAISINASAAEIWPWLVQIGQGRGGFYSYDWLENLFGCDIHNTDRILPEFQQLQVGDGVKLHPQAPPLSVVIVEPNRSLVIAGGRDLQPDLKPDTSFLQLHRLRAYTWAFILDQQGERSTRFIARVRCDWDHSLLGFIRNRMFLEPAHSIMQHKMNHGLKNCVESSLQRAAAHGGA
jgi:hypothetical protein